MLDVCMFWIYITELRPPWRVDSNNLTAEHYSLCIQWLVSLSLLPIHLVTISHLIPFTHLVSLSTNITSLHNNSDVCTKYQEASKIVNLALTGLISQCIPGAKILDLCNFGTTIINTQAMKLYQKKVNGVAVERGVAFPVCVSVNEVICNHSPLASEETVS